MKYIFIVLLLISESSCSGSLNDHAYGSVIVAEITTIYDADAFRVNLKACLKLWLSIIMPGAMVVVKKGGGGFKF